MTEEYLGKYTLPTPADALSVNAAFRAFADDVDRLVTEPDPWYTGVLVSGGFPAGASTVLPNTPASGAWAAGPVVPVTGVYLAKLSMMTWDTTANWIGAAWTGGATLSIYEEGDDPVLGSGGLYSLATSAQIGTVSSLVYARAGKRIRGTFFYTGGGTGTFRWIWQIARVGRL